MKRLLSGWQDSNLRPSRLKRDAITGLRQISYSNFKFQIFKISFSTSLFGLTNIKWINSKPVEREKITTETANFFKYAKFGKIHPEVWGHKALRTLIVYTQLKSQCTLRKTFAFFALKIIRQCKFFNIPTTFSFDPK